MNEFELSALHQAGQAALIIIPTYNEKQNIEKIIAAALAQGELFQVLVVDDGSPDGTADLVRKSMLCFPNRVHLLEREGKLGLGTAYVAGFRWALERNYDYIFEMDADFSHSPNSLPEFIEYAQKFDLVIGSRYKDGKISVIHWDLKRLLLSYFGNVYARLVTGLKVSDATGGFKCFTRKALEALNLDAIKSNGYCFQIETTYRLWKKGKTIGEVPIVFTDREEGTSKMSGGIISEALFAVFKLRFSKTR